MFLLFFASMLSHTFADLLLHREDAHQHFFPFADGCFLSPVSYRGPNYYRQFAGVVEALAVGTCCT